MIRVILSLLPLNDWIKHTSFACQTALNCFRLLSVANLLNIDKKRYVLQ